MPPSTALAEPVSPAPADREEAPDGSRLFRLVVALLVLPLVVSAGLLLFDIGDTFVPTSDIALIEMQVRDVGRHVVWRGLYSRVDWSHPGPAQFFVLAPFSWLTGGSPVGPFVGALAVNAAALVGMVAVARRRGGTPLMLITVLAASLLVRTLGADFVRDPWNCFVTVLPFGLVLLLVWSLTCGDAPMLPLAVGVTSFVAQAHVGFVALALPLLALGVAWLVADVFRRGDTADRRGLVRWSLIAAAVGAVLWLFPLLDVLVNAPSNLGKVIAYFGASDDGETHTLVDGWNVLTAQFSTLPEWLTWHRKPVWNTGEPPSLTRPPVPWLLAVLVGVGVVAWRRRDAVSGRLLAVLAVSFGLGVVAISRIIGPVVDYRLRWTWILGMVSFVVVARVAWEHLSGCWPELGRRIGPAAVAAVVVLSGINVASAIGAGVPYADDSEVLAAMVPELLEAVEGVEGEILVTDTLLGSWYARGVVLALERNGFDARVPGERAELFGDHRVVGAGPPAMQVHVAVNHEVEAFAAEPGFTRVSAWSARPAGEVAAAERKLEQVDAEHAAGRIDDETHGRERKRLADPLYDGRGSFGYTVALYLDTDPG